MTAWHMQRFAALIPDSLKECSGKVFYSGKKAFENPSDIYVLGINPGGKPEDHKDETVWKHTGKVLYCKSYDWSAYRDEKWKRAAGSTPFQRRLQYLSGRIGKGLGEVPSSNLIFKRSTDFSKLQRDAKQLADECWPFHHEVIKTLGVKVVVCLGRPASEYVGKKLKTQRYIEKRIENNGRRWRSETHVSAKGIQVVRLTHPSRTDWTKPATDPTCLVVRALHRS